uniref:Neuroglian n=1 Tax=Biomphalaria glabrata TaxID=6526 RepID=A0A2C9KWE9_BIOGL
MWSILWLTIALLARTHAVSRPPGIYIEPPYDIYYKAGETVELPCKADGEPKPSYDWNRNEIVFNPSGNDDRIVQLPDAGTLVINMPEDKDEGIFQCFAKNDFGKSASKKVNLRQAKLASFAFVKPTYHTPFLGRPYTLPCVPPESVPPPSVFWITKTAQGGFNVVNYDSRVSMDREYRLRITNVKREDWNSGNPYACMAMNNIMRSNSQGPLHYITPTGVTEDFMKVEYLWADQDDRFGLLGSNFSVKCIFSGNPTPDVHWERTDNKTMSDRVNTKSFAQELQITNLQFEDAGTYECWATNSVSQDRKYRTFNIRVNARPYFLEEPKDIEVGVGADVMFTCLAGGVPEPSIEWFVNGESLKDVRDPRITGPRFKHPVETKIFLEKVEQTDHMVFQCNASNIHGYVFADVYLNVLSEAPTIITPPEPETETAEGQEVILVCETTGKPDPIITWFKDDVLITGGRYRILSTGSLVIRAVVLADAGHYKCQAENRYNVTDASGTLVVRRKTRIEQYPFDLEVYAQSEAKFTCSGTTDPEEVENLKILWQKDGKPITAYDQRMTMNRQDNSLTITGTIVRDSGTYTCIATNGLDNHTASATLLVKDKPEPPTNVRWQFCNKNATILWMPGSYNYAPIQYYVLQYNTSFNPDQWTFGLKVNASLSQVNMTLSPHVNYTFRLIAYNKIGASDPSAPTPSVCSTKPDRPYSHPQNLRTLGHQYGKLYIEWTPVPQIMQNGPGFYYVLQILRLGAQAETQIESKPIDDWRTSHYEMNSAMIYEPYRITIKAINSVGEASADPPTIIGYSYEAQPTVTPTNFLVEEEGDTYAIFSWEFDKSEVNKTQSRIRGEFKGFKIIFWEQNQKALTVREQDVGPDVVKNATGNTFTARVENMVPNTKMEAQIAVLNNYFIGVPTETVRFTTQPGFPGPVELLRIMNIGDTHVNLMWTNPFENRGDIEGFDISYRLVKGLYLSEMQDREPQIDDPHTTTAYLSGLMPSSKYRVYIYARTAKGRGEGYFIELVTADPGTPRMPRFSIANVGARNINVTWWINEFALSGTVVFVEWRKLDGPEWLRSTDEVINSWKNISNLEPGTTYEVRIKATNGEYSVASGIEEVRTSGIAVAFSLAGNIGWFIGMILAILLVIGLIVLFILCYKRGFRFSPRDKQSYYDGADTSREHYSGTYDNTTYVARGSEQFGPEPKGYNNDYYDDRDYHNYEEGDDGGFEKKPPSYTSEEKDYEADKYHPNNREYEDYDREPRDGYDEDQYDPDFEPGEPNKFDKRGAPRERYDHSNHSQDDYPDDRNYYDDEHGYDHEDDRYDDRRGYDDRRDVRPGRRDRRGYDDSRDSYDDRYTPSITSSKSGSVAKPSSSTFV